MQRYFAKEKINNELILHESDLHHIRNVMRNQLGDNIEVVYENIVYICCITSLDPFALSIIESKSEDKELNIELIMAVSLVNEQKFDLIIQKLTELGVSRIIPLKTTRSIIKLDEKRIDKKITRWSNICKEASEQSKRTQIPIVDKPITVNELTKVPADLKLICSLSNSTKPIDKYLTGDANQILFAIGPEGGFTKEEEEILIKSNYKAITLGKRVMRVETAAFYVASIINYIYKG